MNTSHNFLTALTFLDLLMIRLASTDIKPSISVYMMVGSLNGRVTSSIDFPPTMSSQMSLSRNVPALARDEELHASGAQDETTPIPSALTSKEKLSATFTIAAAACGLISDGCKYLLVSTYSQGIHTISYISLSRSKQSNDNVQCELPQCSLFSVCGNYPNTVCYLGSISEVVPQGLYFCGIDPRFECPSCRYVLN